ncbi:hypothetical protein, partial [Legionella sp. 28fT52]|uniref:hypothetical protein n=1 Tax=Legionella sp. 28fT52 TaxID=3410134 RepID=UPI003AF9EF5C
SQTDINKNDIPAINFIYNYLQYHRYLVNGEKGYTLMTFLSLAKSTSAKDWLIMSIHFLE